MKIGILFYVALLNKKKNVLSDTTNPELLVCKVLFLNLTLLKKLLWGLEFLFHCLMEYFHPLKLLTLEAIDKRLDTPIEMGPKK